MAEVKKQQRQHGRVPQRVQLGGGNQHQRPQAGLVHAGKHHAGNDENPHDPGQDGVGQLEQPVNRPIEGGQRPGQVHPALEPLHHDGKKLEVEHVEVKHDAHGHFKKNGCGVPIQQGLPDGPGAADVHQQPQDHKCIAEYGCEQGRPNHRLIIMPPDDMGQKRRGEATGGQGHPRCHINPDPQSPGPCGGQIGDVADAADEAGRDGCRTGRHENSQHNHSGSPEFRLDRRCVMGH